MDRKNSFFEQRVSQADVDEWFDDTEAAIWNLMKDALGFGFLSGGVVVQHSPTADLTADVGTFLGYDQLGRRVYLPSGSAPEVVNCAVDEVAASTAVITPGNEKTLALFVEFDRALSDPRLDGNGVTVFYQVDEAIKVNVVQSAEATVGNSVPPPLRSNQILIADVVLIFGQTQILNADIDQSRKEDFSFSAFLHGVNHTELGPDPVPNATGADGGIMSGVDKTKLDTVDWTGAGAAALLGLIARPFQAANIVAPSATTIIVTTEMSGKTPGGGTSTKGIVTAAPNNRVILTDTNLDDFLDGSPEGNKVYGRITESGGVWTLSFFSFDESTGETAFDATALSGATIQWYVQEVFGLDSFPTFDPAYSVPSDQLAGEVPDGTATGTKGKVEFAPDGNTDALKAVQGSDSRLTGAGALTLIRKLASRPSLIFYPNGTTPFTRYRLHQLHSLARGDFQLGGSEEPADFYFEYDRGNSHYPLDVFFNGSPAAAGIDSTAGNADNTTPSWLQDQPYYVYIIGRDKASAVHYALVFSNNAPWNGGPLLDDSSFAFWNGGVPVAGPNFEGGWRYWRFIGCLINGSASSWEIVVIRKVGNHVEYELTQRVFAAADTAGVFTDTSMAVRVPPTSIRALIQVWITASFGGTGNYLIKVRGSEAGTMKRNEIPSANLSRDNKIYAEAVAVATGASDTKTKSNWIGLNSTRDLAYATIGSGASKSAFIEVLGYEEFDDIANSELTLG